MRKLKELRLAIMLLTRLPVGHMPDPVPPLGAVAWAYPIAGALVAVIPAGLFWAAWGVIPVLMLAILTLAVQMLLTGAMHEDGLSDCADGFYGGHFRARRLEIMKDSRVGAYGVIALMVSLGLRVAALAAAPNALAGAIALVALAVASRAPLPFVMRLMPLARPKGLGALASGVGMASAVVALALGEVALFILPRTEILAPVMALAAVVVSLEALRKIGGFTGDTLGATQQVVEIAGWIVLAAVWQA